MAPTNQIFISFALKDINFRDLLVEQLSNKETLYSFVDMPVKQSWETVWKEDCRSKIKKCDGVIALITKNIIRADGQLWELNCAYDDRVPVLLLYGESEKLPKKLPPPVSDREVLLWTWPNIETFLNRL
ncbi:MAG: hypothetical protein ITD27_02790 [Nitrosospira sp.]|nr:hypothetical protein [Nitrosospira sp.]MDW7642134.1 hypothetical protein [Nitrosomonadaceae bacterium]MBI0417269.1 hypothetical protein [Nitrosospira sp.]MBI0418541.1 hypothetical protein [Nitrosospira sp.]MBI0419303.1 hypothetical protein [Nitrosospira sp.]